MEVEEHISDDNDTSDPDSDTNLETEIITENGFCNNIMILFKTKNFEKHKINIVNSSYY